MKSFKYVGLASCIFVSLAAAHAQGTVPIDFNQVNGSHKVTPVSDILRDRLRLTSKYLLNTWWADNTPSNSLNSYIDFGKDEKGIRPPAYHAYALAVDIATGSYDASVTGIPEVQARDYVVTMVKSLAADHLTNGTLGASSWGNQWQSAQWAATTAQAAWLIWDDLAFVDQTAIEDMLVYEANRFLSVTPPAANSNSNNDTKAEENGWNAWALETAAAMLPNHANATLWREKGIEYRMTALARQADLSDTTLVDGQPANYWMAGYNVRPDYAVGNHGAAPHATYTATLISQTLKGALIYDLAGQSVPDANSYNQENVYGMYSTQVWNGVSPFYRSDGTIYWPISIEADRAGRYHSFVEIDALANAFGFDGLASQDAAHWESIHLAYVVTNQSDTTGASTESPKQNNFAQAIATAYLAHWIRGGDPGFVHPLPQFFRVEDVRDGKWLRASNTADGALSNRCVSTIKKYNVFGADTVLNDENSKWEKVPTDNDYFFLKNVGLDVYLQLADDVSPDPSGVTSCAATTNAIRGVDTTCTGTRTQWRLVNAGSGERRLENRFASNMWLQMTRIDDIDDGSANGGAQVRAVPSCNTGDATKWRLISTQ